jgi:hypothetical protein
MAAQRCDLTELPIDQCSCAQHRGGSNGPPRVETEHPPPDYAGPRPPKDAILVHKSGRAHWYGCQHLPSYEYLVPPTWGWIDDRLAWQRIGQHRVRATGGKTALVADARCLDCDT